MKKYAEADRIKNLPPYLFARIEKIIAEKKEQGVDIINLGIGDPDMPTFGPIVRKLQEQAEVAANHQYPSSVGMLSYRQSVADWYKKRFDVELDAKNEVVSLLGSKEGIAHISLCYLNPGDLILVPDPGYPVYSGGASLAGAEVYRMPLLAENGFLPDFDAIDPETAKKAKIMFLNYPNNPTGAVADISFFDKAISFAGKNDIIICHDAAYSEITYDGYVAPSFLQAKGAKDVGIEFHSASKSYNMTGWRVGWAAGNAEIIEALGRLKSNIDSGVFQAIQYAAMEGLSGSQEALAKQCAIYQGRRDVIINGLNSMGWNLEKSKATFYVWAPVPKGFTSEEFAAYVLEKTGVVLTQGNGYGELGEGYFRIALTVSEERLQEAIDRMKAEIGHVEF